MTMSDTQWQHYVDACSTHPSVTYVILNLILKQNISVASVCFVVDQINLSRRFEPLCTYIELHRAVINLNTRILWEVNVRVMGFWHELYKNRKERFLKVRVWENPFLLKIFKLLSKLYHFLGKLLQQTRLNDHIKRLFQNKVLLIIYLFYLLNFQRRILSFIGLGQPNKTQIYSTFLNNLKTIYLAAIVLR